MTIHRPPISDARSSPFLIARVGQKTGRGRLSAVTPKGVKLCAASGASGRYAFVAEARRALRGAGVDETDAGFSCGSEVQQDTVLGDAR